MNLKLKKRWQQNLGFNNYEPAHKFHLRTLQTLNTNVLERTNGLITIVIV